MRAARGGKQEEARMMFSRGIMYWLEYGVGVRY